MKVDKLPSVLYFSFSSFLLVYYLFYFLSI